MATAKDLEGRLVVSTSPHLRGDESIPEIMWTVVAALLPALCVSVYVFGYMAMAIVVVSVLSAMLTESIAQRMLGRQVTVHDGSAFLTGLLLAFTLPPNVGWYVPVVGSAVAVGVAKQCFGGLGNNIFNPALLGRAFVHFAFPAEMNQNEWPMLPARALSELFTKSVAAVDASGQYVDAVCRATPLAVIKANPGVAWSSLQNGYSLKDLFVGTIPGCIGETSALALILGVLPLIALKYVNWRLPLAYIGTVCVLVFVLPVSKAGADGSVAFVGGLPGLIRGDLALNDALRLVAAHALSGGLMLGALFMATDMVTSPITSKGQVIFGIGAGMIVVLIRLYGGYPEGVCYSILLMNTTVPLIDRYVRPALFGRRPKEAKK